MKRFLAYRSCFALASLPMACLGQATIEGTVQLPKTHFAPVENERYEIVSKAGVLATDPPRAVVYLIGNFPKSANLPTKIVSQKDLTFRPTLLAIEVGTKVDSRIRDTYHNIFPTPGEALRSRSLPARGKSHSSVASTRLGWSHCAATFMNIWGTDPGSRDALLAITDAQGHFRLTNLPAGRHRSLGRQQTTGIQRSCRSGLHVDPS
jgi:hypothetical protein